jgi:hypothetical protein
MRDNRSSDAVTTGPFREIRWAVIRPRLARRSRNRVRSCCQPFNKLSKTSAISVPSSNWFKDAMGLAIASSGPSTSPIFLCYPYPFVITRPVGIRFPYHANSHDLMTHSYISRPMHFIATSRLDTSPFRTGSLCGSSLSAQPLRPRRLLRLPSQLT